VLQALAEQLAAHWKRCSAETATRLKARETEQARKVEQEQALATATDLSSGWTRRLRGPCLSHFRAETHARRCAGRAHVLSVESCDGREQDMRAGCRPHIDADDKKLKRV
jgi:hypothetical protein